MKYEQEIEKYVEYRNKLGKLNEDSKIMEKVTTFAMFMSIPMFMLSLGGMWLAEMSSYESIYKAIFMVLMALFTVMFLGSIVTLLVSGYKYNKGVKEVESNKEVSDEIEQITSGLNADGESIMLNKVLIKEGSQKRVYSTKGRNLKLVDWDFIYSKENEEGSQKRDYSTKGRNLKLVDREFNDSKENE